MPEAQARPGPGRLLNFKADDQTRAYLLRAFEVSGTRSFSEWARSALIVAATRELKLADEAQRQSDAVSTISEAKARAAEHAQRTLGRTATHTADCVHPITARRLLPFEDRCGLCGVLIRSKLGTQAGALRRGVA